MLHFLVHLKKKFVAFVLLKVDFSGADLYHYRLSIKLNFNVLFKFKILL